MTKQGKIIFISGPSGVGKGTLINALRERHPECLFPPSCTTRSPRPGEVDGKTYYFVSKEDFEQRLKDDAFLESAQVHGGHLYGTLKSPLLQGVKEGKVIIREFDVQGFEQARERLPKAFYVSIFLQPAEDVAHLIKRIKDRAPISEEEIQKRIKSMKKELASSKYYDYIITSFEGEIEALVKAAEAIIFT